MLRRNGMEPEFCGGGKIVLMLSPCTPRQDYGRLEAAFEDFVPRDVIPYPDVSLKPQTCLTLREAEFSPFEEIPLEKAVGRIAAETKITCPPAVPIVAAGEKIGENEKKLLENSGNFLLKVVK